MDAGKLVVVSTPIGNLGDLTPRAAESLRAADFWLVEDTRVSSKLQAHLGLKKAMHVLNERTSQATLARFLEALAGGSLAAILSDAGTPAISDPGAELVDLCRERGIAVEAAPGASAVTVALMLSGFYAQRYCFLGFLPRKPGPMRRELEPYRSSSATLVIFESPFRIEGVLSALAESVGPRRYALCREMTKLHEQVYRSRLPHIPDATQVPRKGEFTLVVEGKRSAEGSHN